MASIFLEKRDRSHHLRVKMELNSRGRGLRKVKTI